MVWDGGSLDSCTGSIGNYLRYNASHKLSLYLACGIPVIVWKESGLSEWLTKQNVAIAVSSLQEAYDVINNMPDETYKEIILSARKLGEELRNGEMLKKHI